MMADPVVGIEKEYGLRVDPEMGAATRNASSQLVFQRVL